MKEIFFKVMDLLTFRERRNFYILVLIMILVAFAEVFGMSALLVLLRVLAEPTTISTNSYLAYFYNHFGFVSDMSFQIFLSVIVLIILGLSLIVKAAGTYVTIRYATMRGYSISSRLLSAYLHQPYTFFLERNSAELSRRILAEVNNVVYRVLEPGGRLLANGFLALAISIFLVTVDPVVALLSAALMVGGYTGIYIWLRNRILAVGQRQVNSDKERFKLAHEATGGFKEIKLLSLELTYVDRFRKPALALARAAALGQVMSQVPRFFLEAMTYFIILSLVLFLLIRNDGNIVSVIPTLGIFAVASFRLLPAMQQIYGALAAIRGAKPALENVHHDYMTSHGGLRDENATTLPAERLRVVEQVDLKNVSFSYSDATKPAIEALSLKIPAKTTIGFVGGTGAGKTTLIDLILGLLVPDTGEVLVDGLALNSQNIRNWQRSIGYVPQNIYLADASIAENIAFGVPREAIDLDAVVRAARIAALDEYVSGQLPQRYDTQVGERGVRLSGGQRQRIGIARALYHDPDLLVLDEATSALDNVTERIVMDAVQRVRGEKTVVIIAHRLSTVRRCDCIYVMQSGKIEAFGKYDDLLKTSPYFRQLAASE